MVRVQLAEQQWSRILAFLQAERGLLKQARRFATRYEKTLRNYAAVVALGCALLWLRI
jgi:transposase